MIGKLVERASRYKGWSIGDIFGVLLALSMSTVLVSREVAEPAFGIVIIASLVALFLPRSPLMRQDEKIVYSAVLFFLASILATWLLTDHYPLSANRYERYALFLLIIPLTLFLRRIDFDQRYYWFGVVGGACLAGIFVFMELSQRNFDFVRYRAEGTSYAILFGDIILLMTLLSTAAVPYFRTHAARFYRFLPYPAILLGLCAAWFSGTRGAWVTYPFLLAILATVCWLHLPFRKWIVLIAFFLLFPIIAYIITGSFRSVDFALESSSPGERLELWQSASIIFSEQPLLGAGLGSFREINRELITEGKISAFIWRYDYDHPHNEYLHALAERGIVGALFLVGLFIAPLWIFWRRRNQVAKRPVAVGGMLTVIGFMGFAMTEAIFTHSLFVMFYVGLIAMPLALLVRRSSGSEQG